MALSPDASGSASSALHSSNVNLRRYGVDRQAHPLQEHMKDVPSMALSLMGVAELQEFETKQSPFFDPSFWNNDFARRRETRRMQLTVNVDAINAVDYGVMQQDEEKEQQLLSTLTSPRMKGPRARARARSTT